MRHILANLFISDLTIPEAGLLTVTKVTVTDDLKIAKVYFSFMENKKPVEDILEILKSKHSLIRRHVGLKLTLKYIPQLQFYYDDSIVYAQRIDDLIQKIYKND
jgi:ribosome-binding factor A